MDKDQIEVYEKIRTMQEQLSQLQAEYWHQFSNLATWQFWLIFLVMCVAPLVVLYFVIDRKNIFLLGFYGFNIHIWFSYTDIFGVRQGLWGYPYQLIPFIPGNLSLDAVLIPVLFMFVYQWTLNHKKNFYIYTIGLSLFLSFIFKPILTLHHLFKLHNGINFFHLFLLYCVIFLLSKIITNIFLHMQKNRQSV
ncbi:CBO0543 family protein [Halalkalibacter alkaliphilus]|uniref:Uncharacterized protein n=1 Tax=Halalkalibacter alkaliphilus TaxID=2917993 RepID=A0A9X2I8T6_9BACI|nr:CBO0543 family protein [Halalkalibacter alkaliphilus]MCL7749903.1 hypothetical protein [Halalkalibacter alkaliphilus]